MAMRLTRKSVMAILVVAAFSMLAGTGQAWARTAWWHLNTLSAPGKQEGGEGQILVEAVNLGDAMVNAAESPVTVQDVLPGGVTPVGVHGEGGGSTLNIEFGGEFTSCSISGQTVSCTRAGLPVFAYERIIVAIAVKVAHGAGEGINEVRVTGGETPDAVSRKALSLTDTPPSYGVENYELTPEEEGGGLDTQAGSHPFQLTSTLLLNTRTAPVLRRWPREYVVQEAQPAALTKDLHFNLPAGFVGNPTPLPKCRLDVFESAPTECPPGAAVGIATSIVTTSDKTAFVPWAETVPLFSLEPSVGEPARFGFWTLGGPVILDTSVRTGGDYAVVVSVSNIPEFVEFIGSQVTFWGVPADPRHDPERGYACLDQFGEVSGQFQWEFSCPAQEKAQPLLDLPTACGQTWRTGVEMDAWSQAGQFTAPKEYSLSNDEGERVGLDGCNRLSFEPSIKVAPDGQQASTPTGLSVQVHVPQEASLNPTGLAASTVKDTTVTLPAGVGLNPAGADGLMSCSLEQAGLESPAEQSCPEAAKVGTVEIHTPLLPNPLVGAAYLAAQNANPFGSLIALYLVAKDPVSGVIVKLAGQVTPDPVTGQLVSTFKNTPPLPFEDLTLHFFGGSRAPLGTPALCGSYTTTASIAPWSGNAPVDSSSVFEINSGPNHTPCPNPPGDMSASALPFGPELTTGSLNIQAGAFTPFTMTMSREDGNQNLDAIQLKMPSGLLGEISKVKLCGETQANAGSCGPESQIGETTVSVGLGGNPYTVKGGKVYITGPYAGAPYGLSIVNPAKAGPFDLGQVVVRAKIEVDPITSAITITSDSTGPYRIPQIIDGIPLQIKHVNVTINREGFTFNPTDCEPQQIGGSLTSSEGAVSALHVPFQVTNCAVLGFKPIFNVSTSGMTSRKNGASLHVKLTYPKAPFGSQANIGYVKVDLPKQLPSRLETLNNACPAGTFNQNPAACPAASKIGYATATTPVLPVHLGGPAYFVSHGGAEWPELIIALQGEGITVYLHGETFISHGITSSTFKVIPDVPIGTFELTLPEGPYSALAAPGGHLCSKTLRMPTAFHAQNGMQISQATPIKVTGCAKHKNKHKHHHHKHNKKHHKHKKK